MPESVKEIDEIGYHSERLQTKAPNVYDFLMKPDDDELVVAVRQFILYLTNLDFTKYFVEDETEPEGHSLSKTINICSQKC